MVRTMTFRAAVRRTVVAVCAVLAVSLVIPAAFGEVSGSSGSNVQDGDNTATSNQNGSAASGDAIAGGQVLGLVVGPGGRVTVDASNTATNASATTGDVRGSNDMGVIVGLSSVLGQQAAAGISNHLRSVGAGSEQSLLTADQIIGPAGPLAPAGAAPSADPGALNESGPLGPPGPVGPALSDSSSADATDAPATIDAQPTGPPGPDGPPPSY